MQTFEYRREPITKAFMSLEFFLGILGFVLFSLTIGSVDKATVSSASGDINLDGPEVLRRADDLAPARLAAQGKLTQAVEASMKQVEDNPRDVVGYVCAGKVFCKAGMNEGLQFYKTAIAMAPRNRHIKLAYARALASLGDVPRALEQYKSVIAMMPTWYDARMERAQLMLLNKDTRGAAEEFAQIATEHPDKPEARLYCGIALARSGRNEEGMEEYMKGVAAESAHSQPKALKVIVQQWGDLSRARFDLRRLVDSSPADPMLRMRLAEVNLYMENLDDAKQCLLDAKKLAPQNSDVRRWLAIVYYKLGQTKLASIEFGQYVLLEKAAEEKRARRRPG